MQIKNLCHCRGCLIGLRTSENRLLRISRCFKLSHISFLRRKYICIRIYDASGKKMLLLVFNDLQTSHHRLHSVIKFITYICNSVRHNYNKPHTAKHQNTQLKLNICNINTMPTQIFKFFAKFLYIIVLFFFQRTEEMSNDNLVSTYTYIFISLVYTCNVHDV